MKKMKIFLASSNQHKYDELKEILKGFGIGLVHHKMNIIEADVQTLEECAADKAEKAFKLLKKPLICEDTGVYLEAYKDFPGIYPKRVYLSLGFKGILKLLEGEGRKAYFKTAIAYADGKQIKTFSGELHGTITEKVHDLEKNVLPYEKIFVPNGYSTTLSSIPREEKNKISHRAIAAHKFGGWLRKMNK